jgi:choline dehydrogenase-like flavoprotein
VAFVDSSAIETRGILTADVCIVGSGPAGLAIALELERAGLTVLLLESGGRSIEAASADLDRIENAAPATFLSDRRFGGTRWYGRCVPFDPIDFEERSWVPAGGWPIARADLESRYADAARFLGLAAPDALGASRWRSNVEWQALQGGGIEARAHVIVPSKDLARRHSSAVARSSRVSVVLHATVTKIELDITGRCVHRLEVRKRGGQELFAHASRYVLACGGFENARLLLLLAENRPAARPGPIDRRARALLHQPRTVRRRRAPDLESGASATPGALSCPHGRVRPQRPMSHAARGCACGGRAATRPVIKCLRIFLCARRTAHPGVESRARCAASQRRSDPARS